MAVCMCGVGCVEWSSCCVCVCVEWGAMGVQCVYLCRSVVLVGVSGGVGCVLSEEHLCVLSGE